LIFFGFTHFSWFRPPLNLLEHIEVPLFFPASHRASQPASQPVSQPASQLPCLQIASILIKTGSLWGVLKGGRKGVDQERRRTLINNCALINGLDLL